MTRIHKGIGAMLVGAILTLPACDGGGMVAGIDRGGLTGGSVGPVSGFGSVIVNDVHYGTEGAEIIVNGVAATEADLEVGYVVVVRADIPADGSAPTATSIEFGHDVIGPLTSVDIDLNRVVILGQTVSVDDATSYGNGIAPASAVGLAALPALQMIRVSGLRGANGDLLATRVELGQAGADLEVTGVASSVDAGASTLQIADLVVDFSGANLDGFANGAPVVGERVKAQGARVGADGELVARGLERREIELSLVAGEELEVEGLITSFSSPASFSVAGFPVVTGPETEYEHGDSTLLGPNVRVEVEGSVGDDGALVADEIEFQSVGEARIEAQVQAVDATDGTLTLLGITVRTDGATSFEDSSPAELRPFGLHDLNAGDPLRVVGSEIAPGTMLATRVQRTESLDKLVLRGIANGVADPEFLVLGVTVLTDAQTDLENDFFATAEGRRVHVEGDITSGSFLAEKVEIKD